MPLFERKLSVEELLSLHAEIASLSKIGAPLPEGLRAWGREIRGRLGNRVLELCDRLERGEKLSEAVGSLAPDSTAAYKRVLEIGLSSGRLQTIVENLSDATQRSEDARRLMSLETLYPKVVAAIAVFVAVFMLREIYPIHVEVAKKWGESAGWFYWIPEGATTLVSYGLVAVAALVTLVALVRRFILSWRKQDPIGAENESRGIAKASFAAMFSDYLAILVESGLELPEAVSLAGGAVGNKQWEQESRTLAANLRSGQRESARQGQIPAMALAILRRGGSPGDLASRLRRYRDDRLESVRYQRLRRAQWAPLAYLIFIAGGATLAIGLLSILPLASFNATISDYLLHH